MFRSLSQRIYQRQIPFVLLLHVGAFDAKMMPDLLALLRERGFTFTTLQDAMKDATYRVDPGIGYPGGRALQEIDSKVHHVTVPLNQAVRGAG